LKCNGEPADALNALSAKLIRHDSRATPELLSLATHWDKLKVSVHKGYLTKMSTEDGDDEQTQDEDWDVVNKTCQSCRKCHLLLLCPTNLLTDSYHLIGLAYKFLLTL